ncbi:MAG: S8 family serine peptidase [bacterium]
MRRISWLPVYLLFVLWANTVITGEKQVSKYWVFFKDKRVTNPAQSAALLERAKARLSRRALKRRAKVRRPHELIDTHDYPVSETYLRRIEELGYQPVVVSNWLNAASFLLRESGILRLKNLPFVSDVRPVARAADVPQPDNFGLNKPDEALFQESYLLDYGTSIAQNELIQVPKVHDLGVTAKGVWIGMLDTGFKVRGHEAFENLDVIAEFDFIHHDANTEDEAGQDSPNQQNHGTQTLSTIAAFKEGKLIGPAFNASFLLAKTEILTEEIPAEEDNWVAGLEWLESQGVDIVSSSLGYASFPNRNFYSPSDMDGKTAVTTRAADLAVSRGVVVVNSAGNSGDDNWRIVIAPADGDSVIAVGAVTSAGDTTFFSSAGPTADGRIKPDVLAMGAAVKTALPSVEPPSSTYAFSNGTSFSAPAVAGVAALVLSAHPNLTPVEVGDALRKTASRAATPDNATYKFGWGIVDAYAAVLFHGMAFSNSPVVSVINTVDLQVSIKVASKFGVDPNKVSLIYANSDGNFENVIKMHRGNENNQYTAIIPAVAGQGSVNFYFVAADSSGDEAVHPFGAPDSSFTFSNMPLSVGPGSDQAPKIFELKQNYPNPFNPSTTIAYKLPVESETTIIVSNLLGQRVKVLVDHKKLPPGSHTVTWDGTDRDGKFVASGVYFYMIETDNFKEVRKMLLVQ